MRSKQKKAVVLAAALLTVFLLANWAVRSQHGFPLAERAIATLIAPLEFAASRLGYGVRQAGSTTGEFLTLYRNNQSLRVENEALSQKLSQLTEVSAENERLRAMLDYKRGAPQFDFVVAPVVGRDPGTWTQMLMIGKGSDDGLAKDMPVVTARGLVGSVAAVFSRSARVQLLLDPRSAVGAIVQRTESRVAAIVEGNGAQPLSPRMINLARDADVIVGDRVVTSGFGGIFPKGVLIGEVVRLANEEGGLLKVAILKPAADFDRLEEVMVIVRSREPAPLPAPAAPVPGSAGR